MAELKKGKFCHNCQRDVLHTAPKTRNFLHCVLTILTCGAWGFIWGIAILTPKSYICSQCGAVYSWLRAGRAKKRVSK